jgi:hypothetical protein
MWDYTARYNRLLSNSPFRSSLLGRHVKARGLRAMSDADVSDDEGQAVPSAATKESIRAAVAALLDGREDRQSR